MEYGNEKTLIILKAPRRLRDAVKRVAHRDNIAMASFIRQALSKEVIARGETLEAA